MTFISSTPPVNHVYSPPVSKGAGDTAKKVGAYVLAFFGDLLMLLPALGLGLYGKFIRSNFDPAPDQVKKDKPPILLIHGNGYNEMQWVIGRQFLKGDDYGSVFSLNLDGYFTNQPENGMEDYLAKVEAKFEEIRKLTGRDDIILVGHSMGGLVAAQFEQRHTQNVKRVITLSTPWYSPPLLEKLAKIFTCFKNPKRFKQMRGEESYHAHLISGIDKTKYCAIYSTADPLVPGKRGSLGVSNERAYSLLGHYTPMVSPSVWHQIQTWVKQVS